MEIPPKNIMKYSWWVMISLNIKVPFPILGAHCRGLGLHNEFSLQIYYGFGANSCLHLGVCALWVYGEFH